MNHVQTARTKGAKAGFRQYVGKLAAFDAGTPQAAALDELLEAGTKKEQFDYYCEKFLSAGEAAVSERGDDKRAQAIASIVGEGDEDGVQVVEDDDDAGIIERTQRLIQRNKGTKTTPRKANTRKRTTAASPLTVGDTFVYHGKENDTLHKVVGTGKTKRGKAGLLCRNAKGVEKAWNVKSIEAYLTSGRIEVVA